MKLFFKNNKKLILLVGIIVLVIAGLLDIKYQGLFYQVLPATLQSFLSNIF